ncbi:hypothetical protein [Streptomyces sp. Caat 7-52]|uniref:hypothetical protein n=1 Tax=Streptomyces sp. Caat 7-52 TaxID=2949637 RepID=UPI00203530E7|nr:hypothetical protein [Streptomyces sp. Caat 7-52]
MPETGLTHATNSTCRNRSCAGDVPGEEDDTVYCTTCAELADGHDRGAHDHAGHAHCPACRSAHVALLLPVRTASRRGHPGRPVKDG